MPSKRPHLVIAAAAALALTVSSAAPASAQDPGALRVYMADVEGGQATLFVTPAGESLLVDAGWAGNNNRDADRIVALCKQAGISRIDNLLVTHYHNDHVGGVPQLAAKFPIGRFIDHGDNTEFGDGPTVQSWQAYEKLLASGHIPRLSVKPGDILPIKGMQVEIVSSNGDVISRPLSGGGAGGQNPECAKSPEKAAEATENDRSVGMMITFGQTRILDLGDLTWNRERPLMCPVDKLGKVDVYIASHHGFDRSGSPALVHAVQPRVAVMENGGHKGAEPAAWTIVESSPGLKDLWQLHTAEAADAHNVKDGRIINLKGPDAGHALLLVAHRNRSFSVTNSRTGETVNYPAP